MRDKLNLLIEKHCETIKHHVETIGGMLSSVAGGAADPLAVIVEAEALAHQLKGSSGTAGFAEISRTATALDDQLKILCRTGAGEIAIHLVTAMKLFQALDRAARDATPHTSTLYQAA